MNHTQLKILPIFLVLAGCAPGSTPAQTSSTPAPSTASIITQALTPVCASALRDRKVIPDQARGFGIDETAVCECGIRKVQDKVAANPAILIDVLRSVDSQINLLVQVGGECSQELLTRALTGQPYPTPTPSYYPYPSPTSSPIYNPIPTAPPDSNPYPVPTQTPVGPY